ncbi:hypothetical protein [Nesterenkonia suensis]
MSATRVAVWVVAACAACGLVAALLLAPWNDRDSRDHLRGELRTIFQSYVDLTTERAPGDSALTAYSVPDLYGEPDEYATLWTALLSTQSQDEEALDDERFDRTEKWLQQSLGTIVEDGEVSAGPFSSGGERLYLYAKALDVLGLPSSSQQALQVLGREACDAVPDVTALEEAVDLQFRCLAAAPLLDDDRAPSVSQHLGAVEGLTGHGPDPESDRAKSRALAGLTAAHWGLDDEGVRDALGPWIDELAESQLTLGNISTAFFVGEYLHTAGEQPTWEAAGINATIEDKGEGRFGLKESDEPDPQLTYYLSALGVTDGPGDVRRGMLPDGGWINTPASRSAAATAIANLVETEQLDQAVPGRERDAQRALIDRGLDDGVDDVASQVELSALARSVDYRPAPDRRGALVDAGVEQIEGALAGADLATAAAASAALSNFGIEPHEYASRLSVRDARIQGDDAFIGHVLRQRFATAAEGGSPRPSSSDPAHREDWGMAPIVSTAVQHQQSPLPDDAREEQLRSFVSDGRVAPCGEAEVCEEDVDLAVMWALLVLSSPQPQSLPALL